MHLARGLRPVWEVLEPELAADGVKGARLKRERTGITFSPIHCGTLWGRRGAGAGEHPWVKVKTYHMTRRPHLRCEQAGRHSRAACHVEHSFARTKRRLSHEQRRPWPKDGGHQLGLVNLWSITAELPSFRLAHLRLLQGP
jgi:hypothetical protein